MKKLLAMLGIAATLAVGGVVATETVSPEPANAVVVKTEYFWHYQNGGYYCYAREYHKTTAWHWATNTTYKTTKNVSSFYCISRIGYP